MSLRTASFFALLLLAVVSPGGAQSRPRYVVILNSFEQQFSPHNVFKGAFRAELTLRSAEPIQFIDVSLPSAHPARDSEATLAYVQTTFATHRPDLIVPVGAVAAMFAQTHRQRLFPQTPMLFSSVDQRFVHNSSFAVNEAAVAVTIDATRIVDNIVRVLPNTRTLAVVLGTSPIEGAWRDALRQAFKPLEHRLQFIWFDDHLPFEEMLTRSRSLPPGSAILFAHLGVDARGVPQVEERALPQLRAVANAPIFGVFDSQLGQGVVGGPVVALEEHGRRAASVALRILQGDTPRSLTAPPQGLTAPTFDAAELERWGISESRLPPGSVVLFRQPTAWQRYRTPIIATAGIGLAQTALFAGLFMLHLKRKRADRLRQESETRFRLLADTAPVMIWVTDDNKKCTDVNRAWLQFTGRTLEQELGDGWAEGIHADDVNAAIETYTSAFDRREPFRMEYRLRRSDGEFRWILDTGTPRFTADGSFVGYTGSAIDVSVHKQAEAALSTLSQSLMRAQEQERMRIARELHDDVCQRIAAFTVDLDEIRQRLPSEDSDVGRVLDDLAGQALALGTDVQALSHRLHSSKLDVLGLALAAESFCRELSAQQLVTIRFSHDGVPEQLPHDTALGLFRVMQEALMNAVKHSEVSEFDVALRRRDDSLCLTVSDHGVGFNADDVRENAGLGLVSMRERVGLIDGELLVQSRPGEGTTIRATVPTPAVEWAGRLLPASAAPDGLHSLGDGELNVPRLSELNG